MDVMGWVQLASSAGASPRLGVLRGERILEVGLGMSWEGLPQTMDEVLRAEPGTWERVLARLGDADAAAWIDAATARLLPPVTRPGKILAIGLNYREHVDEQRGEEPAEPLVFAKMPTSIIAPGEAIVLPPESRRVDYEGELAVIIGRGGRRLARETAMAAVAGFAVLDDVTARDLQKRDKQFVRSKSFDTFCPLGPVLAPAERFAQPLRLAIETRVNGELRQQSSTACMIFDVPALLVHLSAFCTLEPGDIIATGTPSGVGAYREPPSFLAPGDLVEISIEGLGTLRNPVC